MKRLVIIVAGFAVGAALVAPLGAIGSPATQAAAKLPAWLPVVIRHQVRGCHSWSVNGNAYRAVQTARLARGGTIQFLNIDVMPHKLIQKSGPAVRFVGKPALNHMGAKVSVVFSKAGTYVFGTKPGEDYVKGAKTIGEDNVLELTVKVS